MSGTLFSLLPGIGLAWTLSTAGGFLATLLSSTLMGLPRDKPPVISPIMMSIVLGMCFRNALGMPVTCTTGIKFCLTKILRLGIVLLGIRLSLTEASEIGGKALPVIIASVVSALFLVTSLSVQLGLSSKLGALIAAGTGICGATAIVALAPSILATDEETSYAVACITLSGMMAMLTYPFAAHWLFAGDSFQAGLFLGTSVHETAQVAGAGMVYQEYFEQQQGNTTSNGQGALNVATVTKLVRNLGLLVVVPALSIYYHRKEQQQQRNNTGNASAISSNTSSLQRPSWWSMVPLFVIGFAGMSLVRTVGDMGIVDNGDHNNGKALGILSADQWITFVILIKQTAELCLGIAMAAVGLGTSYDGIRKIGGRPMLVGFFSAAVVGIVSIVMIKVLY